MAGHQSRRPSQTIRVRSAELRQEQTPAEQKLWRHLRGRKLDGVKFRRQHPIGRFIADFCCVEHRLIIEVDGQIHVEQRERDEERTQMIAAQGYRVLRFSNQQVLSNCDAVLAELRAALVVAQAPRSANTQPTDIVPPLPRAGEGDRG